MLNYKSEIKNKSDINTIIYNDREVALMRHQFRLLVLVIVSRVLMPAFKKQKINFISLINSSGQNSAHLLGNLISKEPQQIFKMLLGRKQIQLLLLLNITYMRKVIESLSKDKNVFVEKPLALIMMI